MPKMEGDQEPALVRYRACLLPEDKCASIGKYSSFNAVFARGVEVDGARPISLTAAVSVPLAGTSTWCPDFRI